MPPPQRDAASPAGSDVSGAHRWMPTICEGSVRGESPLYDPSSDEYVSVDGAPKPWAGTPLKIDPSLPVGWERVVSSDGREVFVDHVHGTHTLSLPPGDHVSLPAGGRFEQRVGAGNRLFFVDHARKVTQWGVPEEYADAHRCAVMDRRHTEDGALLEAHVRALHEGALSHETRISTMRHSLRHSLAVVGAGGGGEDALHGEHDATIAPRQSELPDRNAVDPSDPRARIGMQHAHHGHPRLVRRHKSKVIRDFRAEARRDVEVTLAELAGRGRVHEDADFEPPADVPDKMWLRPDKLRYDGSGAFVRKGTRFRLFDSPVPSDAKQGTIGDCWLISSLGLLSGYQDGRLLSDLFPAQTSYDPALGAAVVRLCVGGVYENVLVDDRLPCLTGGAWNDSNRCLSFALSSRHQLWSPFVEKAYAKVCRGYLQLISGSATEALALLTGSPTVTHNINCPEAQIPAVWASLERATRNGSLMVISTVETSELGLVPNHAYALWGIAEISYNGGRVKLFRIHNPHGHGEWKGRWSDGSPEWTPEAIAQTGEVDADDGTFYMELEDVRSHFDEIVVCGVHPEWVEHRLPVAFPCDYTHQHAGFEMVVGEASSMVISLTQPPQRVLAPGETIVDLSFVVLSIGTAAGDVHPEGSCYFDSAPVSLKGTALLERDFPPGRYFVVPFSFWNKREGGSGKSCTLVIQSSAPSVEVLEHELSLGQHRVALREYIVGAAAAEPPAGHVKQSKTLPMTTYYRSDGHGIMVWEENHHQSDALRYDLNFDVFSGMWSSRGSPQVSDAVPPLHGKLVAVALSVGITEDRDAQYTWKYTWGKFTKNRQYQLHLDDLADIHCPITGPYDLAASLPPPQQGPTFVKEQATRQACRMTLPVDYDRPHPCVDIVVDRAAVCHLAMLPGPNAAEQPELRTADQDGAVAVDFSFVVLDANGAAVASAPLNVMGSAVAAHELAPGRYRVVPFNHSNKRVAGVDAGHRHAHVELVAFTTEPPVRVAQASLTLREYLVALRRYIVSMSSCHQISSGEPVLKHTRHDGHGTLIWIDNLCEDKEVFHAMQFQTHDGIAVNRAVRGGSPGEHYEDVVPPSSGKLVMVAWSSLATGESISQASTLAHSNGWKAARSFDEYRRVHHVELETTPVFQPVPADPSW